MIESNDFVKARVLEWLVESDKVFDLIWKDCCYFNTEYGVEQMDVSNWDSAIFKLRESISKKIDKFIT